MSNSSNFDPNPYFNHDMDRLCIVCSLKIAKSQASYSIHEELLETEPKLKVHDALQLISNFKESNFQNGPQKICQFCYNNTSAAVRFQELCNKSVFYLESYLQHQEEMKNFIKVENPDSDIAMDDNVSIKLEEITVDEMSLLSPESMTTMNTESSSIDEKPSTITKANNVEESEKQVTANGVIKVKCKYCQKYYRDSYIAVHRRLHTGEKPYKCKVCDKRFTQIIELKKHGVTHTDKRDYLCNVCGKSFKLQSTLHLHSKIHTGERNYKCQICGKIFNERKTLEDHYSTHSGENPLTCEVCGKFFPTKSYLRQHMIIHEKIKRHECVMCGNRFSQAHSLRSHIAKYCKGK